MMRTSQYIRYIHRTNRGRWVVAAYDQARGLYIAPVNIRERRRLGTRANSAGSPDALESISYSNRASALRRAEREYGNKDA